MFSKEKAGASVRHGRGVTGHGRRRVGGGMELGGARLLETTDMRSGPPQSCPKGLPNRDSSTQQGSGQRTEVLGRKVSSPAGRGRMEDGNGPGR